MDELPELSSALFTSTSSSFLDLVTAQAPDLLPYRRVPASAQPGRPVIPHGTTIAAATFVGGVLLAGDRRTTMGNLIAGNDVDKLDITDDYSAVGFAGTVGVSLEMVRLFAVELSHYEKIEGVSLSLPGKVGRLATMVKGNLEMAAANGMVSLPLFVGFDTEADNPDRAGRIFSFDVVGGRHEETGYHSIGSGSPYANSSLKKLHDPDADGDAALRALVEALYDAADEDSATGGPDIVRKIYPTAIRITAAGAVKLTEAEIAPVAEAVIAGRTR